ncbi:hypothetical protein IQ249_06155 [Lusitaniella coriacea LEGE 07157]|uniref:Uncharacterized protein n=1 Tax=Lusitaniella coriacea LEGE 07157 TaxID=945747 RepID=A0A8J7DP11_9CYAN|nr:hypothetical protein [Lusitaniella coriacea]MBE9115479.1 hypothetical protein [Lusitaniella coriacea LEGE 07157]
MFPWIEVLKKVFVCELIIPENLNRERICTWLRSNHAGNVSCYYKNINNQRAWIIQFSTEDEKLIRRLQDRCKEKAFDSLKNKGIENQNLKKSVKDFRETVKGLRESIKKLEDDNNRLRGIEYDRQILLKKYQLSDEKNSRIIKELNMLKYQKDREELPRKELTHSSDICMLCGKPAIPGEGICRSCSL